PTIYRTSHNHAANRVRTIIQCKLMTTSHRPIAAWIALGLAAGCSRPSRTAADLVITHANVWTGDAAQPEAKGIAIVADRIVAVGGADEIERWRGSATREINAGGR